MKISVQKNCERLIWLLTVVLLSAFIILEFNIWGKYVYFGSAMLIMLLSAVVYDGIIRIRLRAFHGYFLLFTMYVLISSVWAWRPNDSINRATSLIQMFICFAMVYIHYDRSGTIDQMLSAIKWSGYFVVVYSIAVYGLDAMLESAQDIRMATDFSNVNTIAMSAALSCMIQWNELLHKRSIWSVVMMIPSVILITATQSRKAFVLLLAGIFGVYIMMTTKQQSFGKKLLKICLYVAILFVGLRLLLSLPIFSGSLERMEQMLNFWTKSGKVDHSTQLRNDMVKLGIEWFQKYPILGIGMGNPHILAGTYLNFDAYLHNNFVELLCGGGIVGFAVYYIMYVHLFIELFKYRKADHDAFSVALVWLGLVLIMNYGMVTYYSKTQWFYLLVHFINVKNLKNKHREMMENAQKPVAEGIEVSAGS